MRLLLLVLAAFSWISLAIAEPDAGSAKWNIEGCRAQILLSGKGSPDRDIAFRRGVCVGQIVAIKYFGESLNQEHKPCIPIGVTLTEATKVVVDYLDQQPKRLHKSFLLLAEEALSDAWPCKPGQGLR